MGLTQRQSAFCDEYLIDLNATQAAIRAGYSPKYAGENADKLLKNTNISLKIQELIAKRADRTGLNQDRVIDQLGFIAFSNLFDFMKVVEKTRVEIGPDGNPEEVTTKKLELRSNAEIPPEKMVAISSVKITSNGIELKLCDKIKPLEMIGRHLGMFTGKIEVCTTSEVQSAYNLDEWDEDDLRSLSEIYKKYGIE